VDLRREDFEPCWPVLQRYLGDVRPAATMLQCGLSDPLGKKTSAASWNR